MKGGSGEAVLYVGRIGRTGDLNIHKKAEPVFRFFINVWL